ncbi:hypothetical protein H2204_003919 [Knufia peltigerae]|uniref:Uncharacterized protein n=1 Tax=Knufia peltigerae TaxID=1002370 RepID=A0AA38YA96_9EURO|nr:hypothetical protein H2204_003919 [Knufia peltigerae]
MNAAQVLTRRMVTMGPRLTTPVRYSSSAISHSGRMTKGERGMMRSIFGACTLATATGVLYAAARSGGRQNARFARKRSSLDSTKWFAEGADNRLFK